MVTKSDKTNAFIIRHNESIVSSPWSQYHFKKLTSTPVVNAYLSSDKHVWMLEKWGKLLASVYYFVLSISSGLLFLHYVIEAISKTTHYHTVNPRVVELKINTFC